MVTPPAPPSPPPPVPPGTQSSFRSLRRSRTERMVGGVAGGIAETYGVDVALVRIGFVLAMFLGGLGVVLYGVAWIVVPEADTDSGLEREFQSSATQTLAFVLVGLGAVLVFGRIVPDGGPNVVDFFWPLALIAGGVAILVARVRDEDAHVAGPTEPAVAGEARGGSPAEVSGPAGTVTGTDDTDRDPVCSVPPGSPAADAPGPRTETARTEPARTETAWTQTRSWPRGLPLRPPRPPRPPRPRSFVGPLVVSVLLVFAGTAALLDASDVVDVNGQVALALALLAVGVGLVATTWYGRARGLVVLGLLLTVPVTVLAVIDVPFEGGTGERVYRPQSATELRDEYRLAAGQMTLDLRDLTIRGVVEVEASVAFGELRVWLPSDVNAVVDASVGAGAIDVFGISEDGISADLRRTTEAGSNAGTVRLELRSGMGAIKVDRFETDGGTILEDAR